MIKTLLLILILTPQADAGRVRDWLDQKMQKLAPLDPTQFEQVDNADLIAMYLEIGAKASWANRTNATLKVLGDQLRRNHSRGWPLTDEQTRILSDYKKFESEVSGIKPWSCQTYTDTP